MFDSPFDFLTLVIAIVAIIFARQALGRIALLQRRLDAVETAGAAATRTAMPPPLAPLQEFEQTLPAAPPIAPPPLPEAVPSEPDAQTEPAADAAGAAPPPLPQPPPAPEPTPGFEETLGTRWVVWIGGLTLALGGFFMVRYSIEAGLLGPWRAHDARRAVCAGAARRR